MHRTGLTVLSFNQIFVTGLQMVATGVHSVVTRIVLEVHYDNTCGTILGLRSINVIPAENHSADLTTCEDIRLHI